jgi:hypothetical protein
VERAQRAHHCGATNMCLVYVNNDGAVFAVTRCHSSSAGRVCRGRGLDAWQALSKEIGARGSGLPL